MLRKLLVAVLAVVAVAAMGGQAKADVCGAVTGNLVVNCGFETGDLTGWTLTPASSDSNQGVYGSNVNPSAPHSGLYAWWIGAMGEIDDVISQILATIPGTEYLVQFHYQTSGSQPSHFNASWDGVPLFSVSNAPTAGYMPYSFLVTATGSDTISFGGYNSWVWEWLDDVSVAPVPEPISVALVGVGLVALGMLRHRRRSCC